jgi:hypothetical protein
MDGTIMCYTPTADQEVKPHCGEDEALAAFCLTLPGKTLYLTPLLSAAKFRNKGRKEDVVRTFWSVWRIFDKVTVLCAGDHKLWVF